MAQYCIYHILVLIVLRLQMRMWVRCVFTSIELAPDYDEFDIGMFILAHGSGYQIRTAHDHVLLLHAETGICADDQQIL